MGEVVLGSGPQKEGPPPGKLPAPLDVKCGEPDLRLETLCRKYGVWERQGPGDISLIGSSPDDVRKQNVGQQGMIFLFGGRRVFASAENHHAAALRITAYLQARGASQVENFVLGAGGEAAALDGLMKAVGLQADGKVSSVDKGADGSWAAMTEGGQLWQISPQSEFGGGVTSVRISGDVPADPVGGRGIGGLLSRASRKIQASSAEDGSLRMMVWMHDRVHMSGVRFNANRDGPDQVFDVDMGSGNPEAARVRSVFEDLGIGGGRLTFDTYLFKRRML
jgi:hypothetical protein